MQENAQPAFARNQLIVRALGKNEAAEATSRSCRVYSHATGAAGLFDRATALAGAPVRADVLDLSEADAGIRVYEDHRSLLDIRGLIRTANRAIPDFSQRGLAAVRRSDLRGPGRKIGPFCFQGLRHPTTVTLPHMTPAFPLIR